MMKKLFFLMLIFAYCSASHALTREELSRDLKFDGNKEICSQVDRDRYKIHLNQVMGEDGYESLLFEFRVENLSDKKIALDLGDFHEPKAKFHLIDVFERKLLVRDIYPLVTPPYGYVILDGGEVEVVQVLLRGYSELRGLLKSNDVLLVWSIDLTTWNKAFPSSCKYSGAINLKPY